MTLRWRRAAAEIVAPSAGHIAKVCVPCAILLLQVAQTCQLALGRIRYWRGRRAEEAAAAGTAAAAAPAAGELKGSKKEQFSAAFSGVDAAAACAGEESGSPFLSGEPDSSFPPSQRPFYGRWTAHARLRGRL